VERMKALRPVGPGKAIRSRALTCRGEMTTVTHLYIRPFTKVKTPFITIVGAHLVRGIRCIRDFSNLKETDPDMGSCPPGELSRCSN